jgi:hypothetical protein
MSEIPPEIMSTMPSPTESQRLKRLLTIDWRSSHRLVQLGALLGSKRILAQAIEQVCKIPALDSDFSVGNNDIVLKPLIPEVSSLVIQIFIIVFESLYAVCHRTEIHTVLVMRPYFRGAANPIHGARNSKVGCPSLFKKRSSEIPAPRRSYGHYTTTS